MKTKIDVPCFRDAALLMPAGADRDLVIKIATIYYEENGGLDLDMRLEGLRRSLAMFWKVHEDQVAARDSNPPRNMREYLSADNRFDRVSKSRDALWNAAFRFAREEIFRSEGRTAFTPEWAADRPKAAPAPQPEPQAAAEPTTETAPAATPAAEEPVYMDSVTVAEVSTPITLEELRPQAVASNVA